MVPDLRGRAGGRDRKEEREHFDRLLGRELQRSRFPTQHVKELCTDPIVSGCPLIAPTMDERTSLRDLAALGLVQLGVVLFEPVL